MNSHFMDCVKVTEMQLIECFVRRCYLERQKRSLCLTARRTMGPRLNSATQLTSHLIQCITGTSYVCDELSYSYPFLSSLYSSSASPSPCSSYFPSPWLKSTIFFLLFHTSLLLLYSIQHRDVVTSSSLRDVDSYVISRKLLCRIWGTNSGGYEEFYLLGYNTM
jgi:hypothetical protein